MTNTFIASLVLTSRNSTQHSFDLRNYYYFVHFPYLQVVTVMVLSIVSAGFTTTIFIGGSAAMVVDQQ